MLKPCRFCGNPAVTKIEIVKGIAQDIIRFKVRCSRVECGASQYRDIHLSERFDDIRKATEEVVQDWNRAWE